MSTTRIKDKLSRLVPSQLPEFVQSEYPTFITFLKAYYEFLEQDQNAQELLQNARSYNDIDTTIESFVQYFIKQYYDVLPKDLLADKRLLVKRINDLYSSKGSENSYNLLFQILFNKEVNYRYPVTQVLKASDGKWSQKNSIYIETIYGDPAFLANKIGVVKNAQYESEVSFFEKRSVKEINTSGTYGTSVNKFEIFFDNTTNPTINFGDLVQVNGFLGKVIPSIGSVRVIDGGSGFRVGDIIEVSLQSGTGARLKVIRVAPGGTILNVQLITFGINYPQNFYYNYSVGSPKQALAEFEYISPNIRLLDNTTSTVDEGSITRNDYSIDAFEPSYVGTLLGVFKYEEGNYTSGVDDVDAVFSFGQSAKNFYPGFYITNDGFLSDDIYLENEDFYQPYVYQLSVEEQLKKYKDAVFDILHPAGKKLSADYALPVNVDFNISVKSTLNYIVNDFTEFVPVIDQITKSISKALSTDAIITDTASLTYTRTLSNTISVSDVVNVVLTLNVTDGVATTSSANLSIGASVLVPTYSYDYFLSDYTESDGYDGVVIEDSFSYVLTP